MPNHSIIIANRVYHVPSKYKRKQFAETYPGEKEAVMCQIDRWADAQEPVERIETTIQIAAQEFLHYANA